MGLRGALKSFLTYLLGALKSIWTNGYHRVVDPKTGVVLRMDGFISSILGGVFVTSVFTGLASTRFIVADVDSAVKPYVVRLALALFFAVNIGVLVYFMCRPRWTQRSQGFRNTREKVQAVIPLAGLFIFLFGILLMDFSNLFGYLSCVFGRHNKHYDLMSGLVAIFYYFLKSVFALCVYIFICLYSLPERKFRSSSAVRYFLCLIAACSLFLYYDFETWISSPPSDYDYCDDKQLSKGQLCNCRKTSDFAFGHSVEENLQPFYVEFLLLVAERVLHMFNSMITERKLEATPG